MSEPSDFPYMQMVQDFARAWLKLDKSVPVADDVAQIVCDLLKAAAHQRVKDVENMQ